jgi:hypothetical protein
MATNTIPLNTFKTITYNPNSSSQIVYTAPVNVTTVVLMAQVSNVDPANNITTTAFHSRNGNFTSIIKNSIIPVADASNILTGKLVLQTGDSFVISANTYGSNSLLLANSAHLILSILETANQ